MTRAAWIAGMIVGTAMVQAAHGDVLTVGAAKDAMIFGTAAGVDTGNASGKGPAMFAGADGSSNIKRSLIQFDVSAIPPGATITGATMTLYLAQIAGSGGGSSGGTYPTRIFGLYDMLQDWGEGTSGSPTNPGVGGTGQGYARVSGDSTWDYAVYPLTTWKQNGTDLHGGNFGVEAAQSTFTSFTLNSAYAWSSAGMVADIQAWVNGTATNHGWMLRSDNLEGSPTSFLGFWTKDGAAANSNPGIAPSLSVTYAVPEPGTIGVLLGGGVALVVSRRRGHG